MGYRNPLTGPFTVDGGTVDSVTTVLDPVTVDGPVAVNGGSIDSVTSVVESVTANGGHVDTVTTVTTVADAVAVASGTVSTVVNPVTVGGGSLPTVGSVTNPVVVGSGAITSGTLDTVKTSVPMMTRDAFFWPSVSGESFPPTLSTYVYSFYRNKPAYTTGTLGTVTFGNIPRVSPDGKANLRMSFQFAYTGATGSGASSIIFGYGNAASPVGFGPAGISVNFDTVSGHVSVSASDGGGVNAINDFVNIGDSQWHTIEVDLSSAGDVTLIVDGRTAGSVAALLPPSVIFANSLRPTLNAADSAGHSKFSQFQMVWS